MTSKRSLLTARGMGGAGIIVAALASMGSAAWAPAATPNAAVQSAAAQHSSDLANLRWRPIGPATMGGRIADLAAVSADTFYVGVASGNLWEDDQPRHHLGIAVR